MFSGQVGYVYNLLTQKTRDIQPMLGWRCASVVDAGPTSKQHWFNVACSLWSPTWIWCLDVTVMIDVLAAAYVSLQTVTLEDAGRVVFVPVADNQELEAIYLAPEQQTDGVINAKVSLVTQTVCEFEYLRARWITSFHFIWSFWWLGQA